jgi:hypothetical protein
MLRCQDADGPEMSILFLSGTMELLHVLGTLIMKRKRKDEGSAEDLMKSKIPVRGLGTVVSCSTNIDQNFPTLITGR